MNQSDNIVLTRHLSEEDIAFCAQEMVMGRYQESVSSSMQAHLEICQSCKDQALDFYRLIKDEPLVSEAIKHSNLAADNGRQNDLTLTRPVTLYRSTYRIGIAASVLALVSIGIVMLLNRQVSPEKLYSQYYSPYHDVVTAKNSSVDPLLAKGLSFYSSGQYDSAILTLSVHIQKYPSNSDSRFYLASSYLAKGEAKLAIREFKTLANVDSAYSAISSWYLALAYLNDRQTDKAQVVLKKIMDEHGFYADKASKILHDLK